MQILYNRMESETFPITGFTENKDTTIYGDDYVFTFMQNREMDETKYSIIPEDGFIRGVSHAGSQLAIHCTETMESHGYHMAEDGEELIRKEVFDAADKEKWDEMAESLPRPEIMEQYTKKLYEAGQSFGGWDFVNLCLPEFGFMEKCQEHLFDAAREFLLLSD